MSNIKITWHGHACFTLEYDGYIIAIDPYDNTTPGYSPLSLTAHKTLCSHSHGDHSCLEKVCMPLCERECPFKIKTVSTFHDKDNGAKRGSNIIHVLSADGMTVVHAGDLGHLLSAEQAALIGSPDVLMLPVGGFYTVDAVDADAVARQLGAKVVIPMHYRSDSYGYSNIATAEGFLALRNDVKMLDTNTLHLTRDTPAMTAVFKYEG